MYITDIGVACLASAVSHRPLYAFENHNLQLKIYPIMIDVMCSRLLCKVEPEEEAALKHIYRPLLNKPCLL